MSYLDKVLMNFKSKIVKFSKIHHHFGSLHKGNANDIEDFGVVLVLVSF